MAQPPSEQNYYHHSHRHSHAHQHPQLQLPPQFRNPFDLLFDERTGAINYNYIRPYIPNQLGKPDELVDPLVMRRPRRTRTTFTTAQIAELEQHFLQGRYLTSSRLAELSAKLALGTAQVKIWFKNRRRRHKIQIDQQKDHNSTSFNCEGMPHSPSMPQIKTDPNGPPNIQSHGLVGAAAGGGGVNSITAPDTLTPSPTPSTPNANVMDNYGETYYYNNSNHQGAHGSGTILQSAIHPHAHHATYPPSTAAAAQFFSAQASSGIQHQQQHHHHQLHHQQQQHLHATQYRAHAHTSHHHQNHHQQHLHQQYNYQQHKAQAEDGVLIKNETDYNYNNASYFMRMSSAAAAIAATAATTVKAEPAPSVVADGRTSAMSPHSEVYEPLTPKNDESPMSLCNGGVDAPDEMDESNAKPLQALVTNNINRVGGVGGGNGICNNLAPNATDRNDLSIMDDCSGSFTKYNKISNEVHEGSYQCTMDTLVQAYNHRNTSSNAQFAYCFN